MSFQRNILASLEKWKKSRRRKPLVLRGARQVGKTTLVKSFGETFDTFIYLNLDLASERQFFERGLGVREIVDSICLEKRIAKKGKTLLFLDEIQNCAEAVAAMRYFYEEMPDLFVIGAGSLLEIMTDMKQVSFPVGRVEYRYLFPMTFEEFLLAIEENEAAKLLNKIPLPAYAHETLERLFKIYTLVGGMPEAVAVYKETRQVSSLATIYESIVTSFSDDVAKYAKNSAETTVIRHVMETAPLETGKRITFEHFGNGSFKSKEVGNALRTLERAMILYLRYPTTGFEPPLECDLKRKPRLQFLDTGLLNYKAGIQGEYFETKSLDSVYKGIAAEQIVGQELLASNSAILQKPIFWVRELAQSNAEVDFILRDGSKVIPVEVKSGKTGTLRSLHSFIDRSKCPLAARLYSGKYSVEKIATPQGTPFTLVNLPLYLCSRIWEYVKNSAS